MDSTTAARDRADRWWRPSTVHLARGVTIAVFRSRMLGTSPRRHGRVARRPPIQEAQRVTPFAIHVEVLADTAMIGLEGELDVTTAPELRDNVVRLVSEGRNHIIFECSHLAFVDSTGLGVLIGARARCLAANGAVALEGVRPALQRLLDVTGIDGLFAVTTA